MTTRTAKKLTESEVIAAMACPNLVRGRLIIGKKAYYLVPTPVIEVTPELRRVAKVSRFLKVS